ncbi:MAG: hypothetical protein ABIP58_04440 [Dehalococcoidia bacterium]
MSLVVTVYVPSGIVMAADSRMTVLRSEDREEDGQKVRQHQQLVLSDSAYKIVEARKARVGMALYDAGIIDNEPVDSHVHRFDEEVLEEGDDAPVVASKFLAFMKERHATSAVGFHIAGYRREGRTSVPYVLVGHTTREPEIRRVNATEQWALQYGVVRAGDVLVANRMIDENYLPLFGAMPLQEAIDYAVHLIRTTIDTLRFEPRFPTVGGPIDVLVVQPEGMRWVQRKELRGER